MKREVYKDVRGKFHDKTGKFTRIPNLEKLPKQQILKLKEENLYFYQETDKPNTYTRTGVKIEIDIDSQTIFEYMLIGGFVLGIIVHSFY